ncbi:hypothetical protein BC832DRAFT_486210 [Gaertneriomyces semiglobifer]|nr:hypothetical protein BC832DRAFT_486210 [Gaertneriomyces semiglobifer]
MGLDLSDPKIAATYEEIRSGQNAIDWMVLSFLPKLPGVHTGDVLSVIASGPGGVNSFQEELGRLGDSAVYGFLKHDQRFFYVELIPEKPIGLARSTAVTYGKEIGGLLREHDAEVHVSSATELNSQLLVLQCKSSPGPNVLLGRSITSASNNSLSSDKNEDVSEDFARRLQDNAQVKQRLREKADGLLKTAADERSKEDQWFKQKRAKENEMKEDYMKQYKITQERTPKVQRSCPHGWMKPLATGGFGKSAGWWFA